jgi:hypothetical protein
VITTDQVHKIKGDFYKVLEEQLDSSDTYKPKNIKIATLNLSNIDTGKMAYFILKASMQMICLRLDFVL